jgi:Zn-dependent M16 (insulinase) family peptidase
VGTGADLYELGYRFNGSALVISRYLRNAWLWDRVRVQGGAYGAFCLLDRLSGAFSLVSYRDPNLIETLDAFDQTAQFLRDTALSEEEVTKSIIGAIGDLDTYMLPDVKGYISMLRYLSGDTDEDRQQMRDEVLGTKAIDFKAFAEVLEGVRDRGVVKILGSAGTLKKITTDRPGWLTIVKVL